MRQAGRYLPEYREVRQQAGTFLDLCYSPDLATEVTLQPIRRFGFDASILFSDILVIPDALGQKVEFKENIGPVLSPIIRSAADLDRLRPDEAIDRLGPVFQTVRNLSSSLPKDVTLIGFAGAPWTVATYMVGGEGSRDQADTRLWAYAEPAAFEQLIETLVDTTAAYLVAQVDAGAEVLQLFDTWAGSLPEREFERWCIAPVAQIVKQVRAKYPAIPIIGFPRGAGLRYADFAQRTGVNGVSIDVTVPLDFAKNTIQPNCAVQGNLDPLLLVSGGAAMTQEVARILQTFEDGPFIFNLGHGIVPQTPIDHVAALVDQVKGVKG